MNEKWKHRDEWLQRGYHGMEQNCCVSVVHTTQPASLDYGRGEHHWCVYAYIYPTHPLFAEFRPEGGIYQDAIKAFPLHGGCSYFSVHRDNDGKITSFQVGCDYAHLHDEHYSHIAPEFAGSVFWDAERLLDFLKLPPPKFHDWDAAAVAAEAT